ncbi:U32 family peptidase [Paenibacillus sp. IB182496]|uniref:U32 family peptidase n=1 Tax=Paenibacillus sabuli TaxID=2772509 RepID=A0A927BPW9_9BACL|nr:peptidase U32 family protein [Paenibacillus sabuli]MBD2844541.1 U32 family peptidase [Paenibacillus sabuli]
MSTHTGAYRPELLATAGSLAELERLIDAGADAFVLGEPRYAMRLPGAFDPQAMADACRLAHARGVRIYAAVNNLIDNKAADALDAYISGVARAGVDAIVFGDPAVLVQAKAQAPQLALHWSAEMTSTNYATADFWGRRGATRVVAARELNMEELLELKRKSALQVEVQVHGMTNIYHSKRSLLSSYADYRSRAGHGAAQLETGSERGLYLIEPERPEERFPIYEDAGGTHIMSADDICLLECLDELLEGGIDSFKIDGLLHSEAYNEAVVRAYRTAIDAYCADPAAYRFDESLLDGIRALQDPGRELSFGFMFKEQVY